MQDFSSCRRAAPDTSSEGKDSGLGGWSHGSWPRFDHLDRYAPCGLVLYCLGLFGTYFCVVGGVYLVFRLLHLFGDEARHVGCGYSGQEEDDQPC